MAKDSRESLFRRLTRMFRSGPIVKRKVRSIDTRKAHSPDLEKSSAAMVFSKGQSALYNTIVSNAFNLSERLARYQDFNEMEMTPEIATALNLYADEATAEDENGESLHIYSENTQVKKLLDELFYDTLNIGFNLRPWVRTLCKYGDLFLYNDVHAEFGLVNVIPIAVNEIEREEGYDREDPLAVRFRWTTMGNSTLENWEVTHIRLLSNDMFLPYGTSMIESARKIWRQLILIEDAMLVYRVVRAPERRVFYIDVGNTPPDEVPNYIEAARRTLRTSQVIDKNTSRVDVRYNPLSVDEDYFIPVRGSEGGTKIDTLQGGQNTAAVEDVQYIQRKLFAALMVPKAYLGFDEMLSSKATLAQEDIRFSRTVNMIQRTIIAELNKLAIIHLVAHGFEGDDLLNFSLHLSNPSTIAQQQKLEIWRTKFEIAAAALQAEKLVDFDFIRKNIVGLTDEQIVNIKHGLERDSHFMGKLAAAEEAGGEAGLGGGGGGGGGSGGGGGGGGGEGLGDLEMDDEAGAGADAGADAEAGDGPGKEEGGEEDDPSLELIRSGDDGGGEGKPLKLSIKDPDAPIKVQQTVLGHTLTKRRRLKHHGPEAENRPDFNQMLSPRNHKTRDVYDLTFLKANAKNPLKAEGVDDFGSRPRTPTVGPSLGRDVRRMLEKMTFLEKMSSQLRPNGSVRGGMLTEGINSDFDIDISIDGESDTYPTSEPEKR